MTAEAARALRGSEASMATLFAIAFAILWRQLIWSLVWGLVAAGACFVVVVLATHGPDDGFTLFAFLFLLLSPVLQILALAFASRGVIGKAFGRHVLTLAPRAPLKVADVFDVPGDQ